MNPREESNEVYEYAFSLTGNLYAAYQLIGACASAGIERGVSTMEALRAWAEHRNLA